MGRESPRRAHKRGESSRRIGNGIRRSGTERVESGDLNRRENKRIGIELRAVKSRQGGPL